MSRFEEKRLAFVREYLVDFNATQAATRAGYSKKTAGSQAHELLKRPDIQAALAEGQKRLAEKTETDAEWVRKQLKAEATDYSEFASHSARVRALELLGKVNGIFKADNEQKADPLKTLLDSLTGNVFGPVPEAARGKRDDDDADD
ncbi:MAG: terminase small subunit [bacterium]